MIGHGVVMEGNKKMRGCLQTFGGHCILEPKKNWGVTQVGKPGLSGTSCFL